MNKPQKYKGHVAYKDAYSSKVFLFTIQLDEPQTIEFIAGQFLSISVGNGVTRQYSIASSPSRQTTIDLLVDIGPGGPGSQFFSKLETGNQIECIGPMGKFNLASEEENIVMLATGTGIAPFRSMLDHLFEKQKQFQDFSQRNIYLYLGFRYEENIFWHDYFESKQVENPNFHYTVTLSQPTPAWTGKKGYIQNGIDINLLTEKNTHFYICGGAKMVKGVLEFLHQNNVPEKNLHFEPF